MSHEHKTSDVRSPQSARVLVALWRFVRLFWAHVRLQWYLLTQGMWRGESAFSGWKKDKNEIGYLAATTGSIFDGTIKPVRVFWDEVSKPNTTLSHAGTSARKQDGAATGVGSGNS